MDKVNPWSYVDGWIIIGLVGVILIVVALIILKAIRDWKDDENTKGM